MSADQQSGVVGAKMAGYPDFGRAMLKDFQFEEGCKYRLMPHMYVWAI